MTNANERSHILIIFQLIGSIGGADPIERLGLYNQSGHPTGTPTPAVCVAATG